jgi:hypothetical protein
VATEEYERASRLKDPAGSYATETLPVLRKHLEAAQSLNNAKAAGTAFLVSCAGKHKRALGGSGIYQGRCQGGQCQQRDTIPLGAANKILNAPLPAFS